MSGTLERPRRAKGESMAEYSARREDYVATHRDVRNGNRTKLAQHDDALAYLLTPVAPDLDEEIAEARQERPELFSQSNPELDALRTQVSQLEANTTALRARIADLESRPPEVREVRVEVPMLSPDPVKHMTEDAPWPNLSDRLSDWEGIEFPSDDTPPMTVEELINLLKSDPSAADAKIISLSIKQRKLLTDSFKERMNELNNRRLRAVKLNDHDSAWLENHQTLYHKLAETGDGT